MVQVAKMAGRMEFPLSEMEKFRSSGLRDGWGSSVV